MARGLPEEVMSESTLTHKEPHPFCPTGEILTSTGLYVTPLDMQPDMVVIEDIAHHLSNICRFTGAVREFYSVAQHCVLVADYLWLTGASDEVAFAGLMHDAAEAYIGDMAGPLKEDEDYATAYRRVEVRLEEVIAAKFGFQYPYPASVKAADKYMYLVERNWLMPHNGVPVEGEETPPGVVVPWAPKLAETMFLGMFNHFTNHREGF